MTSHARAGEPLPADPTLPALPSPGAGDDERARAIMARMVARFGAPSLDDYRRTYRTAGLEWPGDDEVRRRHPVGVEPGAPAGPAA